MKNLQGCRLLDDVGALGRIAGLDETQAGAT
jgi:hypothetical protein